MRLLVALLVVLLSGSVLAGRQSPESILQQATLDMFDGKWEEALDKLRGLQSSAVDREIRSRASFYEARALQKLGRNVEALEAYDRFLAAGSRDETLRGQARYSIVELSVKLFNEGRKQSIDRVLAALQSADPQLRFVAAVQLSYVRDRTLTRSAIPILQEAARSAENEEMQNQATLALLRIDPALLETPKGAGRSSGSALHIMIKGSDAEELKLTLPFSLARMAVAALPEEALRGLKARGINPDKVIQELERSGEVLEIKSDDGVVRLWVD